MNMWFGRFWRYAVAKIEDMWSVGDSLKDVVDGAMHQWSSGYETEWIKITLQGDVIWQIFRRPGYIHAMVKPNAINRSLIAIGKKTLTDAFRKTDDWLAYAPAPESLDNMLNRFDDDTLLKMCRYGAGPAVEQHQDIRACTCLKRKEFDSRHRHHIEKRIKLSVIVPQPLAGSGKITR
jgi:hypothetical protein